MDAVEAVVDNVTFHFTQGTVEGAAPGFEEYFGSPPHMKFLDFEGFENIDLLDNIRDLPPMETYEETLRSILPDGIGPVRKSLVKSLESLYKTMKEHGPFDAVLGYSEGATIAATLILDEQERCKAAGTEPTLKCAIFFAGWPPMMLSRDNLILSDMGTELIDIPTLHVMGSKDPFLAGVMTLYTVCDSDSAILFDHGKGHILPRDEPTLKEIAVKVRRLVKECR